MPEELYGRFENEFPKRQTKTIHKAEITVEDSGIASSEVEDLASVFQFLTEEGDQIIQVSENLLVVNQLQPYRHFNEWESLFYRALDIYEELVSPQKVDRVGFRYINRFEIPASGKTISMEDYFTIYPTIPQHLGETHGPFWVQLQIPQNDSNHTQLITFGTEDSPQPNDGNLTIILDIYDKATFNTELNRNELSLEIKLAHDYLVRAFEGSITDTLREMLGIEQQTC